MNDGATLKILNLTGNIDVAGTAEEEFSVTAIKRGERADLGKIDFEVKQQEHETTIRAFCLERLPRFSDAHIHFTIRIPHKASFIGHTSNGSIRVSNILNVEAVSSNGSICIDHAGAASAQTTNGQIDVSIGSPKWQGSLQFRTRNGGIRVQLPREASAELEARTSNGWVSTEFPLAAITRQSRHHIRGVIGNETSGRQLICQAFNGNVQVARAATA